MSKYSIPLMVTLAVILLAACKIKIIVPEGGSVSSISGSYICGAGQTCEIDVLDFYFDETFAAEPDAGYLFTVWRKGKRRFCAREEKNRQACHITTTGFEDNQELSDAIQSFLESDEIFYLQPIFAKRSSCEGLVPGTGNEFTLRHGEHTFRAIDVPVDSDGRRLRTRFNKCPQGVCSSSITGETVRFQPTIYTALGTHHIEYIAYKGGYLGCAPFFGCPTLPEKIKKRWNFVMEVQKCDLPPIWPSPSPKPSP